ncbi:EAL domain-containing protein [Legionella gresilensis]|uniref:EAL domain-containing protein n=1 Tax=Legionella gresilensis TaxID=91823 RepID=UPI001040FC33|nr:EAL domain-containing protein [Legionella gresilensis]
MTELNILYLEDDPIDADFLKRQLKSTASFLFNLEVVAKKDDYLKAIHKQQYDIILSDYSLPNFDGLMALELKNNYQPDVPFIIVTGVLGDEAAVKLIKAGATDYVLKDNLERLPLIIQRAIETAKNLAQKRSWESLFRAIEDMSYAGFFKTNEKGVCIYTNKHLTEMLGVDTNFLLGSIWQQQIQAFNKEEIANRWQDAFNQKIQYQDELQIYSPKDNRCIWLDVHAVPEHNQNDQFMGYVGIVFDVTHLKETEEKLKRMVNCDHLTQLANRHMFNILLQEAIKRAKRYHHQFAVLFCDLDHFKKINDTYGHPVGDKFLQKAAEILKEQCREVDVVSRFGGDEFVILLDKITDINHIKPVLERIIAAFNKFIYVDVNNTYKIFSTISIGVALYPNAGDSVQALLQHADQALYQSKNLGKNTYHFYDETLNLTVKRQTEIENELRMALSEDTLYLVYQPQFNLNTGKIIGIEALCRWNNPKFESILPHEFIAIAENSNLINKLTYWVCNKAFQQLRAWIDNYPELFKDILLSINLSSLTLSNQGLINNLLDLIEKYRVNQQICFEITETAAMTNIKESYKVLKKFNDIGIQNAIDDFGAGQSSLTHLKSLPVGILKIDSSFILDINNNPNDLIVVKAIINLAKALKLFVIAEGTENQEQLDILKANGCDAVQGFYLAQPLEPEQLIEFLRTNTKLVS